MGQRRRDAAGASLMGQGCPYFAWQYLREGRQAYRPCRNLAQLTRFEADIYEGLKDGRLYSIRPDNLTRWGALDFDAHGIAAVELRRERRFARSTHLLTPSLKLGLSNHRRADFTLSPLARN